MKRDFIRAFRRYGVRPLIIPFVVIASILIIFELNSDDYLTHREDAADLARRIEVMDSITRISKAVEEKSELLKPEYAQIQNRAFLTGTTQNSVDSMQNHLMGLLQSLYFENIKLVKLSPQQDGNAVVLAIDAQFTGVPQQLPRLESALAANQKAMRVNRLQIKTIGDTSGSGAHIEITARFLGLHLVPMEPRTVKPVSTTR